MATAIVSPQLLSARFPILFSGMRTVSTESVAGAVRHRVERARPGTFFRRRDFEGTDRAVESALSRLVAEGELVRVRRGLYWRGKTTRFGMTHPSVLETAVAVGGPGTGPVGVAAAQLLGLTTQVPATVEVAVLEVLRDPHATEVPWPRVEDRIRELLADGTVRPQVLDAEATSEPRVQARQRWAEVAA